MEKKQPAHRWIGLVAAGPPATALAGRNCSHGGTPPTGISMLDSAKENPAATNTADIPNQTFDLIATSAATVATVQSPPAVSFPVIDSAGKRFPGLALIKAASHAEPARTAGATSTSGNLRFVISKLAQPTFRIGCNQSCAPNRFPDSARDYRRGECIGSLV